MTTFSKAALPPCCFATRFASSHGRLALFLRHSPPKVNTPWATAGKGVASACSNGARQSFKGFSCIAVVLHYTPHQGGPGPGAPIARQHPGASHIKLPRKRCRATGGPGSYTCECCAAVTSDSASQMFHRDGPRLVTGKSLDSPEKGMLGVFCPTFHAKSLKPIFDNFNGFPPDSRRLSIHLDRFSVIFSQFQSASVNFNQFQSV